MFTRISVLSNILRFINRLVHLINVPYALEKNMYIVGCSDLEILIKSSCLILKICSSDVK